MVLHVSVVHKNKGHCRTVENSFRQLQLYQFTYKEIYFPQISHLNNQTTDLHSACLNRVAIQCFTSAHSILQLESNFTTWIDFKKNLFFELNCPLKNFGHTQTPQRTNLLFSVYESLTLLRAAWMVHTDSSKCWAGKIVSVAGVSHSRCFKMHTRLKLPTAS